MFNTLSDDDKALFITANRTGSSKYPLKFVQQTLELLPDNLKLVKAFQKYKEAPANFDQMLENTWKQMLPFLRNVKSTVERQRGRAETC